jgi:hypothetical protein
MLLTVVQTIQVAKISQALATADIARRGLFAGGRDIRTPRKIYMVRKDVEWLYGLDPSDDSLTGTANFLYALCAPYNLEALNMINQGGAVSPVSPSSVPDPYDFEVSASSFIVNGESTKTIESFIGYNLLFIRSNIPQSQVDQGSSFFSWNRVTGEFVCSPAAFTGELFQLYPFL